MTNSWGGDRRPHRRAKLEALAAKMREKNAPKKKGQAMTEREPVDPAFKKRYLGDALPKGKTVQRSAEDLIWMNRGTRY